MKKSAQLYYLSNHELYIIIKSAAFICASLFTVNQIIGIAAAGKLKGIDPQIPQMPPRFEQFIPGSGFFISHILALLAVLLAIAFIWQRAFTPVRSLDLLYRLPLGIRTVFIVKIAVGTLLLLAVQAVQLFSLVCVYYISFLPATEPAQMRQGLYLAFSRSPYLRLLLPVFPAQVLFVVLAALLSVLFILTAVNLTRHESSRKTSMLGALVIAALSVMALLPAYSSLNSIRVLPVQLTAQIPLLLIITILVLLNLRWLKRRLLA